MSSKKGLSFTFIVLLFIQEVKLLLDVQQISICVSFTHTGRMKGCIKIRTVTKINSYCIGSVNGFIIDFYSISTILILGMLNISTILILQSHRVLLIETQIVSLFIDRCTTYFIIGFLPCFNEVLSVALYTRLIFLCVIQVQHKVLLIFDGFPVFKALIFARKLCTLHQYLAQRQID